MRDATEQHHPAEVYRMPHPAIRSVDSQQLAPPWGLPGGFTDAREVERIESGDGAPDQRDAGELNEPEEGLHQVAGLIDLASDRLPPADDDDEQSARDPYVQRADEATWNPPQAALDRFTREDAVMGRKHRQQRSIAGDRGQARSRRDVVETHEVPPAARRERHRERDAAKPSCKPGHDT
jgi:hypothetical protein